MKIQKEITAVTLHSYNNCILLIYCHQHRRVTHAQACIYIYIYIYITNKQKRTRVCDQRGIWRRDLSWSQLHARAVLVLTVYDGCGAVGTTVQRWLQRTNIPRNCGSMMTLFFFLTASTSSNRSPSLASSITIQSDPLSTAESWYLQENARTHARTHARKTGMGVEGEGGGDGELFVSLYLSTRLANLSFDDPAKHSLT